MTLDFKQLFISQSFFWVSFFNCVKNVKSTTSSFPSTLMVLITKSVQILWFLECLSYSHNVLLFHQHFSVFSISYATSSLLTSPSKLLAKYRRRSFLFNQSSSLYGGTAPLTTSKIICSSDWWWVVLFAHYLIFFSWISRSYHCTKRLFLFFFLLLFFTTTTLQSFYTKMSYLFFNATSLFFFALSYLIEFFKSNSYDTIPDN